MKESAAKKKKDLKTGGRKANVKLEKEHATKKGRLKEGGRKANDTLRKEREDGIEEPGKGRVAKMDPKKKKKMLDEMRRP